MTYLLTKLGAIEYCIGGLHGHVGMQYIYISTTVAVALFLYVGMAYKA